MIEIAQYLGFKFRLAGIAATAGCYTP